MRAVEIDLIMSVLFSSLIIYQGLELNNCVFVKRGEIVSVWREGN